MYNIDMEVEDIAPEAANRGMEVAVNSLGLRAKADDGDSDLDILARGASHLSMEETIRAVAYEVARAAASMAL